MLIKNLRASATKNNILKIIIGADLEYAPDVNAMSTSQVRHSGSWEEHSGKPAYANYYFEGSAGRALGPKAGQLIYLYDPQAIGGFYDKLLEYTYKCIKINLLTAKRVFLGFQRGLHQTVGSQIQIERRK